MTFHSIASAELLTGPDAKAANSYEQPNLVQAKPFDAVTVKNGRVTFELPPLCVFAATLQLE